MKPRILTTAALVAVLIVATAGVASADRNVFISEGDGDTFDLADLYDGETRTFGEGEHAVTVVREGDSVRFTGMRDNRVPQASCNLATDSCKVVTMRDGGKTMIMIQRDQECGEGENCRTIEIDNLVFGDAHHGDILHGEGHEIVWQQAAACEGGEEACHGVKVIMDSAGDASAFGNVMHLRMHDDRNMVRCPEGDTTMRVDAEDVDAVFLCPKHSLPLETVTVEKRSMQRIELRGTPHEH